MAYTKKTWVNVPDPSNPPSIPEGQDALARFDAENMNRIEEGIKDAHTSKAPSGHGLGDKARGTQFVKYQDFMEQGCGFYQAGSYEDSPHRTTEWTGLIQLVRGGENGAETGTQLAFYDFLPDAPQMWLRTILKGEAGNWVEMIHTGNATNLLPGLGMARFASDSYVGIGVHGEDNPTIIPVSFKPKILIIGRDFGSSPAIYGEAYFGKEYSNPGQTFHIKYDNSQIYIYKYGGGDAGDGDQYNAGGVTYHWYAFA